MENTPKQATEYPSYWVCKLAYLVPVKRQDNWEGYGRKGIRRKMVRKVKVGAPISLDGMSSIRIVGVSCLCYLPLTPEKPENGEQKYNCCVPGIIPCVRPYPYTNRRWVIQPEHNTTLC